MTSARDVSDRVAHLLRLEHAALGDFLVALADFDRARRWAELGHSSLFYFLHRDLGLSKGAAYHRKVAAELIQLFPELVEPLRDGRLCITSVVELAKVLTAGNRAEVVPRFFHCSKRDAKAVAAEIRPAEVVARRDVVTAVSPAPAGTAGPAPVAEPARLVHPDEPASARPAAATLELGSGFAPDRVRPTARPAPRDDIEPLTADLRRLHVTVSRRLLAKLEAARDGLSHALPGASTEQVLEAALDALLAKQAARKGLVMRPRAPAEAASAAPGLGVRPEESASANRGRAHIPAKVKREVWTRDGGRCQWPIASGGVCGATRCLELDHVVPLARGGPTSAANLRVLCRAHNQLHARQVFGDAWMDRFAAGR